VNGLKLNVSRFCTIRTCTINIQIDNIHEVGIHTHLNCKWVKIKIKKEKGEMNHEKGEESKKKVDGVPAGALVPDGGDFPADGYGSRGDNGWSNQSAPDRF
jgi:hypothetical protein